MLGTHLVTGLKVAEWFDCAEITALIPAVWPSVLVFTVHLPTAFKECVIVVLRNYPILVDTNCLTHSTACIVAMFCSVRYSWDCQTWYSFLHPCLSDPRLCGPCPLHWLSFRLGFPVVSVGPVLPCCLSIWHSAWRLLWWAFISVCSCSLNILLHNAYDNT